MHTIIPSILILLLLLESNPALAQLPPDIAADAHLLRAEQAVRDGDSARARIEIGKINLLQMEHELDLSEEFHFRAAKAAAAAGLPERVMEAIVEYLTAVGRGGPRYVEALELLNQAQDEIAARTEPQVTSPGSSSPPPVSQIPIEVQSEKRYLPEDARTTKTKTALKCNLSKWNTEAFFKIATVDDVKTCIAAGADLNVRDDRGITPLHWAVSQSENPSVVEVLFKATAEAHADWHWTNLHRALLFNEAPSVVRALLATGANPKARTALERAPLHWAAQFNTNPAVVKALLAVGVDPNARDENETTPLHMAAEHNENPAVVQALLAGGANLHAQDEYKNTPLHRVARNENPALLQVLLNDGADPKARDEYRNTPLHWAAQFNRNPEVLKVLLAAGADPKARNQLDHTPLHWAAWNENPEVVKALLAVVEADNGSGTEQDAEADAGTEEAKKSKGVDSYYTLSGSNSIANPIPLVQTAPSYTTAAIEAQVEGTLWLQGIIRKTGRVDSFKVISWPKPGEKKENYGLVESAIKEISENWRFKPGMIEGKPVDVLATIEVHFNLLDNQDSKSRSSKDRDQQMKHLERPHLQRLRTN